MTHCSVEIDVLETWLKKDEAAVMSQGFTHYNGDKSDGHKSDGFCSTYTGITRNDVLNLL